MKQINVATPVMDRIVVWERRRVRLWLGGVLVAFTMLAGGLLLVAKIGIQEVLQRQTLDLLTLLAQDPEIIREFWQDTAMIILAELPWERLVLGAVLCGMIGVYLLVTGRKRRLVQDKMSQIAQYNKLHAKKGENT